MKVARRREVWHRAGGHCEYCRLHQQFDELPYHVDHILARKHGGLDDANNLALACVSCSLSKGSNIAGRNSRTGRLTRLFNPRTDQWHQHFRWKGPVVSGRTAIGRVTVTVLNLNHPERVALRKLLIEDELFPPLDL